MTVDGWEVEKEDGEKLIDAAEQNSGSGLEIKLGGDPIYAAQEQASPEFIGFIGAAIVLLIAFGSVVAAGLPLAIALIGLGITSGGLIALLANVVDVPDWTTAVSGLIGIGVGIDYSLLVLTRFRSALRAGKDRHDAVVEAVTTAGRSVIIAGLTVVVAVLGLCLTALPYMYGVAISASLAVLVVMLAAISLLPALLSYLGPRVDRLRIPFLGRTLKSRGGQQLPCGPLEPRGAAAPLARGDRGDGSAARARGAGARDATRLPGRRERPKGHDDPSVLRPEHRGVRARDERAAGDRGRDVRSGGPEAINSFANRLRSEPDVAFVPPPTSTRRATPRSST